MYEAQPDEFIDVCARVTNDTGEPAFSHQQREPETDLRCIFIATPQALTLRLDLHPPSSSPQSLAHLARYLIIEGVSPVSLPLLEPGESHEQRISICLLAQGRYEFGCVVEDRGVKGKRWEAGERVVLEV